MPLGVPDSIEACVDAFDRHLICYFGAVTKDKSKTMMQQLANRQGQLKQICYSNLSVRFLCSLHRISYGLGCFIDLFGITWASLSSAENFYHVCLNPPTLQGPPDDHEMILVDGATFQSLGRFAFLSRRYQDFTCLALHLYTIDNLS